MVWLTVVMALLRLVPTILEMVRDGRIKEATTEEVLNAFQLEFNKRWQARVDAAVAAGNAQSARDAGGVQSNTQPAGVTPEGNSEPDPFDRASARRKG